MSQINKETLQALEINVNPITADDMFEREQAIEERWLAEFREQEETLRKRFESREPMRIAQARVGEAVDAVLNSRSILPQNVTNDVIIETSVKYISMGLDFEIILNAIKDNPILMSEWERFMVMLRMAQEN